MSPAGAGVRVSGRNHELRATPRAEHVPDLWLLGSSDYSARLAAERGLPYVFAHHFSGQGTAEALELYRSQFKPSQACPEPRTFLTVNVVAADSEAEAQRLALPQLQSMLSLRTGAPLQPQRLVEEAAAVETPAAHQPLLDAMRSRWVIGDGAQVRGRLTALAEEFGVDEVMVHPVAGAHAGEPADRAPARERTLELVACAD
ncbi:LLM class flavin-dependent oxidoreductase [Nocardioides alcanivorans]|uniref:LLM class flavin-dependent oxidoreductase n=1 Tax=Nocardioides alcanivorans TaxID=2897352 RepID=UPI0024B12C5F|nr:LLM class flavin-dependent oxidoreductase [Nocardioides alcanivorans]